MTRLFTKNHNQNYQRYHGYKEFFPYHRGLIYWFETAIRSLGDDYENFALPYLDQTEATDDFWKIIDDGESFLSGSESTGCVQDGKFAEKGENNDNTGFIYQTEMEKSGKRCLIRASEKFKRAAGTVIANVVDKLEAATTDDLGIYAYQSIPGLKEGQ